MNIFIKKISFFILLSLCAPIFAFAAEIRLDARKTEIRSGEQFLVDVMIDSKESLNAIEGRLAFPSGILKVVDIRDGNSVINFWLEKPHIAEFGAIVFSGITPGGFSGVDKKILSVVFESKNSGSASLALQNITALYNDGLGTKAAIENRGARVSVRQGDGMIREEVFKDTEPPEDFKPVIASDPNIFDGKYFLVFATQDKKSGVDRYEAREGDWGWFRVVESPYFLKHQRLDKNIYIKAIDKSDNEKIVMMKPKNSVSWPERNEIIGILALLIITIFGIMLIMRWMWRRVI